MKRQLQSAVLTVRNMWKFDRYKQTDKECDTFFRTHVMSEAQLAHIAYALVSELMHYVTDDSADCMFRAYSNGSLNSLLGVQATSVLLYSYVLDVQCSKDHPLPERLEWKLSDLEPTGFLGAAADLSAMCQKLACCSKPCGPLQKCSEAVVKAVRQSNTSSSINTTNTHSSTESISKYGITGTNVNTAATATASAPTAATTADCTQYFVDLVTSLRTLRKAVGQDEQARSNILVMQVAAAKHDTALKTLVDSFRGVMPHELTDSQRIDFLDEAQAFVDAQKSM